MPIIFIHGVNTRLGYNYHKDLAARNELLQRLILKPLAAKGDRFNHLEIMNPFWGSYGVDFRWGQASLPEVRTFEALGDDDEDTLQTDVELVETINALAGANSSSSREFEILGSNEGIFKRAAEKDLAWLIEVILSPMLTSEIFLADKLKEAPDSEGVRQALVAIAGEEVANDPLVKMEIASASSDKEIMDLLEQKILERYEQLIVPQDVKSADEEWEMLGSKSMEGIKDGFRDLFKRVMNAPSRATTLPALELFRHDMHRNFSRFLGDVFVYLNERGNKTKPGPIVSTVLEAIKEAPSKRNHPDEPLIIITHSMGGNILYDILTYYAPDLKVDVWISVASQVAQFEEMKLFKASNKNVTKPEKVKGLKRHVGYWLNVYDPADIFSFMMEPVFADVNADLEYLTGASALKAHSEYFGRADFYKLLKKHIEKAFKL
jgi:hypothetical protein